MLQGDDNAGVDGRLRTEGEPMRIGIIVFMLCGLGAAQVVCAESGSLLDRNLQSTNGASGPGAQPAARACAQPFPRPVAETDAPSGSAMLRAFADACAESKHSALFYNRAYHAEVIDELAMLAAMQKGYASSDRRRLEASRVFIGLAEAFAARAWREPEQAARKAALGALNRAYEAAIQDAEHTLHGFDLLVGRPASFR